MDMTFSFSRINLWDQCPLAWRHKYLENLPELDTREMQIGRATHKAIQLYTEDLMNGNKRKLNSIIGQAVASEGNVDILKETTEIVETFVLTHHKMDLDTIVGVEENIIKPIGRYDFRGIIDLIQVNKTTAFIIDYKSSRKISSQGETDNSLQLSAYALLAQKKYPTLKKFICRFDFVRFGQTIETERTFSDIRATEHFLKQKMDNITKAVSSNEFEAKPSHYCEWCSYVNTCPIKPKVSSPKELASQVLVLEALLKDKRARLKELVSKHGSISVNDEVFDFLPVTSEIYSPDKVIDVLVKQGVDNPFRYLKVANKELKYLESAVYEKLLQLAEDKVSTRFGHKRRQNEN